MKAHRIQYLILMTAFLMISAGCKEKNSEVAGEKWNAEQLMSWDQFSSYINEFNEKDEELYVQHIPNSQAEQFLKENIPRFHCPDKELEKTYYFRWWTFRKHIKSIPGPNNFHNSI